MNKLLAVHVLLGLTAMGIPVNAQVTANPVSVPENNPDVDTLMPQSLHRKFMNYAVASVGPRSLLVPVFPAALRMINPPDAFPREWRHGMGGFGRNYGNSLASQSALETGKFLTSALLHEDFRYRRSRNGNPVARSFHALAFTFIDRSDSGHRRIAFANFAGAAAGGFIGNLYLPAGYGNPSHAGTRAVIDLGGFAARNLQQEFGPELKTLARKFHLPKSRNPIPEWWVKFDKN